MKRYCQTLELKNDKSLIEQYVKAHQNVWQKVKDGQKEVGILDMQIYIYDNRLFMIVDTIDDFDWERDMERLSNLPRQKEWEAYVSQFQGCSPDATSKDKWQLMNKIFQL